MPITLQQGSLDAQKKKVRIGRFKVSYARRFFNLDTQEHVLEPTFIEIKQKELSSVSGAREELDRKGLTEFRISNITITLRNKKNEWDVKNPNGRFKPDAVSRQGYIDHGTKFKVEKFLEFVDGTESDPIPVFEGFIADPVRLIPNKKQAQFIVASRHQILKEANAENVSILHADISLGFGTGLQTEFNLKDVGSNDVLGVLRVKSVIVANQQLREGVDYSTADLLDPKKVGKINLVSAPSTGNEIIVTFIEGRKDDEIRTLVEALGAEAGLTPAQMVVEDVIYRNRVFNRRFTTSKEEWEDALATLTNIDTISNPGAIRRAWNKIDDFTDLDFTNNPVWTKEVTSGGSVISAGTGKLSVTSAPPSSGTDRIVTPISNSVGTWHYQQAISLNISGAAPTTLETGVHWKASSGGPGTQGYFLTYDVASNTTNFMLLSGFSLFNLGTLITGGNSQRNWLVTRNSSGQWKFYHDLSGSFVLIGTITNTTFTTFTHIGVSSQSTSDDAITVVVDDIYFSDAIYGVIIPPISDASPIWDSPTFDGTIDFVAWTSLNTSITAPGSTSVIVETATADESAPGSGVPGAFDAFVVVAGGIVASAQKRFLKYRIKFLPDPIAPGGFFETAEGNDASLTFTTQTAKIALANFLNQSVFVAVTELAKIAAFEWGFTRAGVLFFRARSVSTTPVLTITRRDLKKEGFRNVTNGVDRVFNRIVAKYGESERIVDPFTRGDSSPHSIDKFGTRTFTISGGQILIDPDADIASGLALEYYDRFKDPRRTYSLDMRMLLQLELGDTILLRIEDETPERRWHIGDTSVGIGEPTIGLYGHEQQAAYDVLARVVAVENQQQSEGTTLEVEEVL